MHGDDPCIELGEDMRVPPDWDTRKPYMDTDFDRFEGQGGTLRLYHHVNSLFLLFLAPAHPVLSHPLRDSARIEYTEATLGILKVAGKKRKGAPSMQPTTQFAHIVLGDGTRFPLEACIKGIVMEINQRLIDNPALLLQPDNDQAYLLIVKPKVEARTMAELGKPFPPKKPRSSGADKGDGA